MPADSCLCANNLYSAVDCLEAERIHHHHHHHLYVFHKSYSNAHFISIHILSFVTALLYVNQNTDTVHVEISCSVAA